MTIDENVILYHGSYIVVEKPDISLCRIGKDFGQGFYVTTDQKQAEKFTKTSIRKAIRDGLIDDDIREGIVSKYRLKSVSDLKIHVFEDADVDWLHCVAGHRKYDSISNEVEKWRDYDVICGKIANDNTNLVITAYIDGAYGEIGSERADRIAIDLLEPNNLKDQLCFRTEKALTVLEYIDYEKVVRS